LNESLRKEDVIDGSFPITWFIGENDTGILMMRTRLMHWQQANKAKDFTEIRDGKLKESFLKITVISYLTIILVCTVNY